MPCEEPGRLATAAESSHRFFSCLAHIFYFFFISHELVNSQCFFFFLLSLFFSPPLQHSECVGLDIRYLARR